MNKKRRCPQDVQQLFIIKNKNAIIFIPLKFLHVQQDSTKGKTWITTRVLVVGLVQARRWVGLYIMALEHLRSPKRADDQIQSKPKVSIVKQVSLFASQVHWENFDRVPNLQLPLKETRLNLQPGGKLNYILILLSARE